MRSMEQTSATVGSLRFAANEPHTAGCVCVWVQPAVDKTHFAVACVRGIRIIVNIRFLPVCIEFCVIVCCTLLPNASQPMKSAADLAVPSHRIYQLCSLSYNFINVPSESILLRPFLHPCLTLQNY